jgi:hypothetical protein
VDVLKRYNDLSSVKGNCQLVKTSFVLLFVAVDVSCQLAAANKVHNQVKLFLSLESILHVDDERGCDISQDLALSHHVLELVILHDELFVEYFHRVVFFLSSLFFLDQKDFAEPALA